MVTYTFSEGPHSTAKSVEQVSNVIKEVGQGKRYMKLMRRADVRRGASSGKSNYGAFAPTDSDDPFGAGGQIPDRRVGWRWAAEVTDSRGISLNLGWRVIFDILDDGASRRVVAKVEGSTERREAARFVKSVFDLL